MKAIEFYTTPEGEVTMRPIGEAERQLKETDTDFIQAFLAILREFYPEAYDALMDIYSKNSNNKRYRDFIAVRRFIETLANLIQCGVTLLLGIIALAGALFCNASFHFFTAMACFWLAWVFYTDNEYGIVSVREYFKNRYKKD